MWPTTSEIGATKLWTRAILTARIPFSQFGAYASILLGISVILLIWLGAVYFIRGERDQTERATFQIGSNLARAFEEQLIRLIRAADQTLLYIRDSYSKDRFDMSLWSRNSQFLTDFAFQVMVIDKHGMTVASNIDSNDTQVNLSDREYFKVHAQRDTDELYISQPVLGRVSGKWSIQLTRRVSALDGTFDGIVVISLNPDYLARFYDTIDIGEHGSVTLVGTDGTVRAGSPADDAIGTSMRAGKLFGQLAVSQAGALYDDQQRDGVMRMLSYRQIKGYPLVVVVGLGRDDIFRVFEQNRNKYLLVAGLLSAWLLAMTIVILRYQRGLTRARDAAQAGTRARSEFLATMSHEIRTPMNGVIGMAELLLDSGLQDEQVKLADTLRESAEYLLQLIDDVLDFSKLDAGRIELEKIPFDIHQLVEGAVDVLTPRASARCIYCTAEMASCVPRRVIGDPARLRQVLLNLIGNAIKFTQVGGVTVTVDAKSGDHPGYFHLSFRVVDTGIGIPADAVGLLFREFSQLDSSISRRFGGTGLGLAICKRLVALMGGNIGVESELGHGSTFHFAIEVEAAPPPVERAAEVAQGNAENLPTSPLIVAADAPDALQPLRILVAEDNPTNQMVIGKLLASLGYKAEIVSNGAEAVAACTACSYDLIFMDLMMPEMDGLTATAAIRKSSGPNCRTRIVALTANAFPEDREKCREVGMDGFLAKPVTRKVLATFLGSQVPRADAPPIALAVVEEAAAVFDASVYGELKDVLGAQDIAAVLRTFLADTRQRIDVLEAASRRADNKMIVQEAHALKSSAASLGFMRLSQLARHLEAAAKEAVEPIAPAQVAALSEAHKVVSDFAQDRILSKEPA